MTVRGSEDVEVGISPLVVPPHFPKINPPPQTGHFIVVDVFFYFSFFSFSSAS